MVINQQFNNDLQFNINVELNEWKSQQQAISGQLIDKYIRFDYNQQHSLDSSLYNRIKTLKIDDQVHDFIFADFCNYNGYHFQPLQYNVFDSQQSDISMFVKFLSKHTGFQPDDFYIVMLFSQYPQFVNLSISAFKTPLTQEDEDKLQQEQIQDNEQREKLQQIYNKQQFKQSLKENYEQFQNFVPKITKIGELQKKTDQKQEDEQQLQQKQEEDEEEDEVLILEDDIVFQDKIDDFYYKYISLQSQSKDSILSIVYDTQQQKVEDVNIPFIQQKFIIIPVFSKNTMQMLLFGERIYDVSGPDQFDYFSYKFFMIGKDGMKYTVKNTTNIQSRTQIQNERQQHRMEQGHYQYPQESLQQHILQLDNNEAYGNSSFVLFHRQKLDEDMKNIVSFDYNVKNKYGKIQNQQIHLTIDQAISTNENDSIIQCLYELMDYIKIPSQELQTNDNQITQNEQSFFSFGEKPKQQVVNITDVMYEKNIFINYEQIQFVYEQFYLQGSQFENQQIDIQIGDEPSSNIFSNFDVYKLHYDEQQQSNDINVLVKMSMMLSKETVSVQYIDILSKQLQNIYKDILYQKSQKPTKKYLTGILQIWQQCYYQLLNKSSYQKYFYHEQYHCPEQNEYILGAQQLQDMIHAQLNFIDKTHLNKEAQQYIYKDTKLQIDEKSYEFFDMKFLRIKFRDNEEYYMYPKHIDNFNIYQDDRVDSKIVLIQLMVMMAFFILKFEMIFDNSARQKIFPIQKTIQELLSLSEQNGIAAGEIEFALFFEQTLQKYSDIFIIPEFNGKQNYINQKTFIRLILLTISEFLPNKSQVPLGDLFINLYDIVFIQNKKTIQHIQKLMQFKEFYIKKANISASQQICQNYLQKFLNNRQKKYEFIYSNEYMIIDNHREVEGFYDGSDMIKFLDQYNKQIQKIIDLFIFDFNQYDYMYFYRNFVILALQITHISNIDAGVIYADNLKINMTQIQKLNSIKSHIVELMKKHHEIYTQMISQQTNGKYMKGIMSYIDNQIKYIQQLSLKKQDNNEKQPNVQYKYSDIISKLKYIQHYLQQDFIKLNDGRLIKFAHEIINKKKHIIDDKSLFLIKLSKMILKFCSDEIDEIVQNNLQTIIDAYPKEDIQEYEEIKIEQIEQILSDTNFQYMQYILIKKPNQVKDINDIIMEKSQQKYYNIIYNNFLALFNINLIQFFVFLHGEHFNESEKHIKDIQKFKQICYNFSYILHSGKKDDDNDVIKYIRQIPIKYLYHLIASQTYLVKDNKNYIPQYSIKIQTQQYNWDNPYTSIISQYFEQDENINNKQGERYMIFNKQYYYQKNEYQIDLQKQFYRKKIDFKYIEEFKQHDINDLLVQENVFYNEHINTQIFNIQKKYRKKQMIHCYQLETYNEQDIIFIYDNQYVQFQEKFSKFSFIQQQKNNQIFILDGKMNYLGEDGRIYGLSFVQDEQSLFFKMFEILNGEKQFVFILQNDEQIQQSIIKITTQKNQKLQIELPDLNNSSILKQLYIFACQHNVPALFQFLVLFFKNAPSIKDVYKFVQYDKNMIFDDCMYDFNNKNIYLYKNYYLQNLQDVYSNNFFKNLFIQMTYTEDQQIDIQQLTQQFIDKNILVNHQQKYNDILEDFQKYIQSKIYFGTQLQGKGKTKTIIPLSCLYFLEQLQVNKQEGCILILTQNNLVQHVWYQINSLLQLYQGNNQQSDYIVWYYNNFEDLNQYLMKEKDIKITEQGQYQQQINDIIQLDLQQKQQNQWEEHDDILYKKSKIIQMIQNNKQLEKRNNYMQLMQHFKQTIGKQVQKNQVLILPYDVFAQMCVINQKNSDIQKHEFIQSIQHIIIDELDTFFNRQQYIFGNYREIIQQQQTQHKLLQIIRDKQLRKIYDQNYENENSIDILRNKITNNQIQPYFISQYKDQFNNMQNQFVYNYKELNENNQYVMMHPFLNILYKNDMLFGIKEITPYENKNIFNIKKENFYPITQQNNEIFQKIRAQNKLNMYLKTIQKSEQSYQYKKKQINNEEEMLQKMQDKKQYYYNELTRIFEYNYDFDNQEQQFFSVIDIQFLLNIIQNNDDVTLHGYSAIPLFPTQFIQDIQQFNGNFLDQKQNKIYQGDLFSMQYQQLINSCLHYELFNKSDQKRIIIGQIKEEQNMQQNLIRIMKDNQLHNYHINYIIDLQNHFQNNNTFKKDAQDIIQILDNINSTQNVIFIDEQKNVLQSQKIYSNFFREYPYQSAPQQTKTCVYFRKQDLYGQDINIDIQSQQETLAFILIPDLVCIQQQEIIQGIARMRQRVDKIVFLVDNIKYYKLYTQQIRTPIQNNMDITNIIIPLFISSFIQQLCFIVEKDFILSGKCPLFTDENMEDIPDIQIMFRWVTKLNIHDYYSSQLKKYISKPPQKQNYLQNIIMDILGYYDLQSDDIYINKVRNFYLIIYQLIVGNSDELNSQNINHKQINQYVNEYVDILIKNHNIIQNILFNNSMQFCNEYMMFIKQTLIKYDVEYQNEVHEQQMKQNPSFPGKWDYQENPSKNYNFYNYQLNLHNNFKRSVQLLFPKTIKSSDFLLYQYLVTQKTVMQDDNLSHEQQQQFIWEIYQSLFITDQTPQQAQKFNTQYTRMLILYFRLRYVCIIMTSYQFQYYYDEYKIKMKNYIQIDRDMQFIMDPAKSEYKTQYQGQLYLDYMKDIQYSVDNLRIPCKLHDGILKLGVNKQIQNPIQNKIPIDERQHTIYDLEKKQFK